MLDFSSYLTSKLFIAIYCFVLQSSPLVCASDDNEPSSVDAKRDAPQERNRGPRDSGKVYRNRVTPNWIDGTQKFWYRNDLAQGAREFIAVDASIGKREFAFDHEAIARAMGGDTKSTHLPFERLDFLPTNQTWLLSTSEKSYAWDPSSQVLTETGAAKGPSKSEGTSSNERPMRAEGTGGDSSLTFENKTKTPIEIFWLGGEGEKQSYGKIEAGATKDQHTFGGHRWLVINHKGESLGEVVAKDSHSTIVVDGRPIASSSPNRRPTPSRGSRSRELISPDGKWQAKIENHNILIQLVDSNERAIELSKDGTEGEAYGQLLWTPDSLAIVAFREKLVEKKTVNWIRSSPPGGGRAALESRPYVLPGDAFPTYELNFFRVEDASQIKPMVDRFEHEWLRPRVRFNKDGTAIAYEQTDRGHGRFRVIEVQLRDGAVRNIIDEKSDTFIWTAHTENQKLTIVQWLESSNEILYATERDGWRQLTLVDVVQGNEKRVLTPKGIVVRSVESVDEQNRILWFSAIGRDGQDPYFVHYGYVSLDTGKLTWLTEADGNHAIQFSPNKEFLVDTYSRVDLAPRTELRRVSDGSKVCDLESSDISELQSSGWLAPEVFVSKGRDGQTDIWGVICRPKNFDPKKKYPVIEDIYAGPQGSYVPKTFSPTMRYETLTRLGFIVVKIDGMGTANRSKAFHDVCFKNLKDGGFPDRILWMKSAAARYSEMDLSRVGVYGTSAGGQNAAAAVLFHPEFYHVAVAACGCHDNRMDKASWNEQWMGYPVGPQYSECSNIDNAHRLQGKLFLIVGEMDTNVPPESTMRLADSLIRADKDFDLLVVPNGGHGMGGAYGQRRMNDFFVRHLMPSADSPSTAKAEAKPTQKTATEMVPTALTLAPIPVDAKEQMGLAVTPPPESFFALVREAYREKARAFYGKYLNIEGLPVVASKEVADEALLRTHHIVGHMLAGRKDLLLATKKNGMYLIIIGKNQVYTDMPEYSDHPNPGFQNERVRGTGGKPTSFGEENLLGLALDRYDDESIGVHEFCHTIDGALRSIDSNWNTRLRETFQNAKEKKLYENAYAGTNAGEYWAEICQAYFDCNRVNNWNHGPIGKREQLKVYDPMGYELVRTAFQFTPETDWRYEFPRKQPSVESPPAKLGVDPYYTKFCWAREFTIVGREASDESMLIANNIVRRMFAYRQDILKAFMSSDVKLVVLGRKETLADLPEFRNNAALRDSSDLLARYLTYSPQAKMLVVAEENLIATQIATAEQDCQLIYVLADAIYTITGTREVDPDWENRPRNIWQQYELRLERIDSRLDATLKTLFEKQMVTGKWKGTQAVHSRKEYWSYGVLAYFNAVGQSPTPQASTRAILSREDLAAYDPELYQIVNKAMAYDNHVDWRLR